MTRIGYGMGSVRLVKDRKLNRRLAMKIIHPKLLSHRSVSARFVEEAQICAQPASQYCTHT